MYMVMMLKWIIGVMRYTYCRTIHSSIFIVKIFSFQVTVENFIRVLTGRLPSSTPRSKKLLTDTGSNVLIYLTGHGGDGFLKFQDSEEITNVDLADAIQQMWEKQRYKPSLLLNILILLSHIIDILYSLMIDRYHEMLFIVDTCQAASLYQKFYSPNVLAIGSSLVGEDSLSHHVDPAIGVYIIDRYTYYALEFLEHVTPTSNHTLGQFVCSLRNCHHPMDHNFGCFFFSSKSVRNIFAYLLSAFVATFSSGTLTESLLQIFLALKNGLRWQLIR